VPPVDQHPPVGVRLLLPAGPTAAGLVDAEHPDRFRGPQVALGGFDERGMRGRPAHPERGRDLAHRPVRIPNRSADRDPEPTGRARPRRHLTDRLGERPTRTQRFDTSALTPEQTADQILREAAHRAVVT
jgi:hypothetical protein